MIAQATPTDTPARGARDISAALCELAQLHFSLGCWSSAHSCATEALQVARSYDRQPQAMYALARLATIEAGVGEADACRRHTAEAIGLSRALDEPPVEALAAEALGFLELGLGSPESAVEHLEGVTSIWRSSHSVRSLARGWPLHLADAYVRLGNRMAAELVLERMERRATRIGSFVLAAACERSRAMLASEDTFDSRFRRALHWNRWAKQPFETARTQLSFGERLRRVGRMGDARAQLTAAHGAFQALGARPWATTAMRELDEVLA